MDLEQLSEEEPVPRVIPVKSRTESVKASSHSTRDAKALYTIYWAYLRVEQHFIERLKYSRIIALGNGAS